MDVFIEAVLPRAQLVICGATPVATALCDLGRRMGFETVAHAPQPDLDAFADYVAFVGSRLKAAALSAELAEAGVPQAALERLHAPAGLDIGAITPEEIAVSILAEITVLRRRGQREGLRPHPDD